MVYYFYAFIYPRFAKPKSKEELQSYFNSRVEKSLGVPLTDADKVYIRILDIVSNYKQMDYYTDKEVEDILHRVVEKTADEAEKALVSSLILYIEENNLFDSIDEIVDKIPYSEFLRVFSEQIFEKIKSFPGFSDLSPDQKRVLYEKVFEDLKKRYSKSSEVTDQEIEKSFKRYITELLSNRSLIEQPHTDLQTDSSSSPSSATASDALSLKFMKDAGIFDSVSRFNVDVVFRGVFDRFVSTVESLGIYDDMVEFFRFFATNSGLFIRTILPQGEPSVYMQQMIVFFRDYLDTNFTASTFSRELFISRVKEDLEYVYSQKLLGYDYYLRVLTQEKQYVVKTFYPTKDYVFKNRLFRYLPIYYMFLQKENSQAVFDNFVSFVRSTLNQRKVGIVSRPVINMKGDLEEQYMDVVGIYVEDNVYLVAKSIGLYLGLDYLYFEPLFKNYLSVVSKNPSFDVYLIQFEKSFSCSAFGDIIRPFKNLYVFDKSVLGDLSDITPCELVA
ncbi:MAG TPA: hypothetical protein ENO30_02035 [Thermodesulfobium narugense]|nr:hypothetical protein [Thermodesulfobium narugense]